MSPASEVTQLKWSRAHLRWHSAGSADSSWHSALTGKSNLQNHRSHLWTCTGVLSLTSDHHSAPCPTVSLSVHSFARRLWQTRVSVEDLWSPFLAASVSHPLLRLSVLKNPEVGYCTLALLKFRSLARSHYSSLTTWIKSCSKELWRKFRILHCSSICLYLTAWKKWAND